MTFSHGLGLAVLRVTLGVIFLMHGYLALAVIGPDERRRLHDAHGLPGRRSARPSPGT